MNLEKTERHQLMTRSRWRLPALPAGKGAVLRGAVVAAGLLVLILPIVPSGPEMVGNTSVLSAPSSLDGPIAPALSACRSATRLLSLWLDPFLASAALSALLMSLCCGVTVCWLRQQDVARSIVIFTAILLGLSPAITDLTRYGGPAPLSLLMGLCLIIATEQLRSEAGRGIGACGIAAGMAIASGPLVIPAVLYSLLSMICDRSLRDLLWRSLTWGVGGLVAGFSIFISIAAFSDPSGMRGVISGFTRSWSPVSEFEISQAAIPFTLIADGTGIILGTLAVFGIMYGMLRRPGDLALILTMASSGPLMSLVFGSPSSHAGVISSVLIATLLASWTLTVIHRRVGKSSAGTKQWLLAILLILVTIAFAIRSPLPFKPKSKMVTQWAQSVLGSLPQDSLLITGGSPLASALVIVQHQQGLRPDVIVLDRVQNLEPTLMGLAPSTSPTRTLQAARALVKAGRPLLALPMALHHPLLTGHQLSPWGVVLLAHDPTTPAPDDRRAWLQIDIPDLPVEPKGAWQWIRGEGPAPHASGLMASEVAAASWFAMARREGQLRGDGRWAPILGLLGQLIEDPDAVRKWARQQPEQLISSDETSRVPRISD
ncbi:MAG: hypothetical protein VX764_09510 [Planctomycetota bacterium]|nr:hypothetical protein [Planctomycetota bacterium]